MVFGEGTGELDFRNSLFHQSAIMGAADKGSEFRGGGASRLSAAERRGILDDVKGGNAALFMDMCADMKDNNIVPTDVSMTIMMVGLVPYRGSKENPWGTATANILEWKDLSRRPQPTHSFNSPCRPAKGLAPFRQTRGGPHIHFGTSRP